LKLQAGSVIIVLSADFLTRHSRNQKSYKLLFTLLDISQKIAQIENVDTENLSDAKLY
jgi:hypothetical protein